MDSLFFLYAIIVLLFSVVIHEVAHGYAAEKLGDPTARMAGRLTLNPIKHLDFFGSFVVPLIFFLTSGFILGWAKPVPYNPNRLYKDYKYGPLKVALAGPAANIALAVIFGLFLRFVGSVLAGEAIFLLSFIVFLNILLAVFNLIPIPPLDGSKILTVILPKKYLFMIERVGFLGIFIIIFFLFLFFSFIFNIAMFFSELIVGAESWRIFLTLLQN